MAMNRRPVSDPVELQQLGPLDHDPPSVVHATLPTDLTHEDQSLDRHWFGVIGRSCTAYHNFEVKPDFLRIKYSRESETMYVGLMIEAKDTRLVDSEAMPSFPMHLSEATHVLSGAGHMDFSSPCIMSAP